MHDLSVLEGIEEKYDVSAFAHGEEKTAIDYATNQKIKNEQIPIVCGDAIDSAPPYDFSGFPNDLYYRQFTVRDMPPPDDLIFRDFGDGTVKV